MIFPVTKHAGNFHCEKFKGFRLFAVLTSALLIVGCSSDDDGIANPNPRVRLAGTVVDSATGNGIEGAVVAINTSVQQSVGASGQFLFVDLNSPFQVNACADNYKYACRTLSNSDASQDGVITVALSMDKVCESNGDIDGDGIPCVIDWITDSDFDGVADKSDECIGSFDTIDKDRDGNPDCIDEFIDSDGDGIPDDRDQCRGADDRIDSDSDGTADCNLNFVDYDQDGLTKEIEDYAGTNPYEFDTDFDLIDDLTELGYNLAIPSDIDGDGQIDAVDIDSDGDGSLDINETGRDADVDGILDNLDGNSTSGLKAGLESIYLESTDPNTVIEVNAVASSLLCTCTVPNGTEFSSQFYHTRISNFQADTEQTLNIQLSDSQNEQIELVHVLDADLSWAVVNDGTSNTSNPVSLNVNDGGFGDLDRVQNGTIVSILTGSATTLSNELPETKSGCFIATAAYGTPLAEDVILLKNFRDHHLLSNGVGRYLVQKYYILSPPIAAFISRNNIAKYVTLLLLYPVVLFIKYPVYIIFFVIIMVALCIKARHLIKPND